MATGHDALTAAGQGVPAGSLRERALAREILIGTFLNLGSPLAAEACALAGYDWLLVDLEHGGGGEESLLGQLLAADAHDIPVLVRVETPARIRTGKVLDLGAAGVMFPRIDTASEAEEAVRHLRYPPVGDRGVATYNRSCGFGQHPEALATTGAGLLGVVQMESVHALEEVEEIAAIPGVDVLFVGPRDLSHALGMPGRFDDPAFLSALARVSAVAASAGVAAGILAGDPRAVSRYIDLGYSFVALGSDSSMLATAAVSALDAVPSRGGSVPT